LYQLSTDATFLKKPAPVGGAGLCSGGFASGENLRRRRTTACNNLMVRPTNKFPFMDRASVGRQSLRYIFVGGFDELFELLTVSWATPSSTFRNPKSQ
jgi:hypothetical protein